MPGEEDTIAVLTAKLEAAELRNRVNELQTAISRLQLELKESNTLLCKQRLPPRIRISSTERQQIAARQGFVCYDADVCPLRLINPPHGLFTADTLWECDHDIPWSESGMHTNNIVARCVWCHSRKTRAEAKRRSEARFE